MEEFLNSSSPPTTNHFSFGLSDASVGLSKQPPRHHSHSYSGNVSSDKSQSRMQSENDHLRERVRSCEKGLGKMYQMILNSQQRAKNPPTFNHNHTRSASASHQYSPSPSPVPESYQVNNGYGVEFDDVFNPVPQVAISDLQTSIERLLSEQDALLSKVDDWKQITEAAKRERVLAIDEKDQLLRETHSLRVAVESAQSLLGKMEEERESLKRQVRDLKDELISLKRDNEKAREMRSLAIEEKSKMRLEFSELQHELRSFQNERDELYKKTLLQQSLLEEVLGEKERLEHDLGWLSSKSGCDSSEGKYSLKEEPSEAGKVLAQDILEIALKRSTLEMPWGFTFEGGMGTEFYHQDPSIVITGVANRTPAADTLRFGDRVVSFGSYDFHDVTKKEAAEAIRSCDFTTVTVEVGRTSANVKPAPQDVRIPGKKDFGFSYESRLFVTSMEEDSPSAGLLLPGDEIIQVQGKSAFNMKPSTLKQLLKSCKDGVSLTIQQQPGINLTSLVSSRTRQTSSAGRLKRDTHDTTSSGSLLPLSGTRSVQSHRLSSDFIQSPGTPKSSISESSAGYHSLAHSIPPSEVSNTLVSGGGVGSDSSTGQMGTELDQSRERRQVSRHLSDGDMMAAPPSHHRPGSVGGATSNGFSRSSYRNRPADYYSPRRSTASSAYPGQGHSHKPRSYSMSNYKSAPAINPDTGRADHAHHYPARRVTTPHSPSKVPPPPGANNKAFSMSADNLDSEPCTLAVASEPSRSTSHPESHHDKPRPKEVIGRLALPTARSRGHLSVSTGNMQTHV